MFRIRIAVPAAEILFRAITPEAHGIYSRNFTDEFTLYRRCVTGNKDKLSLFYILNYMHLIKIHALATTLELYGICSWTYSLMSFIPRLFVGTKNDNTLIHIKFIVSHVYLGHRSLVLSKSVFIYSNQWVNRSFRLISLICWLDILTI